MSKRKAVHVIDPYRSNLLILAALADGQSRTAEEVAQRIRDLSENVLRVTKHQVHYSDLIKKGCVDCMETASARARKPRRHYALTKKGKAYLAQEKETYALVSQALAKEAP